MCFLFILLEPLDARAKHILTSLKLLECFTPHCILFVRLPFCEFFPRSFPSRESNECELELLVEKPAERRNARMKIRRILLNFFPPPPFTVLENFSPSTFRILQTRLASSFFIMNRNHLNDSRQKSKSKSKTKLLRYK